MARQAARVGEYLVGESIGKGAFGEVFKGLGPDGDTVAIKKMKIGLLGSNTEQIMDEIELLRNLSHENIVEYRGYVADNDHVYIVLEYVESGSLQHIIKTVGCLDEGRIAIYIRQVLHGLAYLHGQGVVHRDIKSANILTTKDGTVKLADFGVAAHMTQACQRDNVVGTPYWMAPEVIEMKGAQPASDIWSVGCTVIELLTGSPPYFKMPTAAALFKIVTEQHPPLPDHLSSTVRDFLMKTFVREPSMRPSAVELIEHPFVQQANNSLKGRSSGSEMLRTARSLPEGSKSSSSSRRSSASHDLSSGSSQTRHSYVGLRQSSVSVGFREGFDDGQLRRTSPLGQQLEFAAGPKMPLRRSAPSTNENRDDVRRHSTPEKGLGFYQQLIRDIETDVKQPARPRAYSDDAPRLSTALSDAEKLRVRRHSSMDSALYEQPLAAPGHSGERQRRLSTSTDDHAADAAQVSQELRMVAGERYRRLSASEDSFYDPGSSGLLVQNRFSMSMDALLKLPHDPQGRGLWEGRRSASSEGLPVNHVSAPSVNAASAGANGGRHQRRHSAYDAYNMQPADLITEGSPINRTSSVVHAEGRGGRSADPHHSQEDAQSSLKRSPSLGDRYPQQAFEYDDQLNTLKRSPSLGDNPVRRPGDASRPTMDRLDRMLPGVTSYTEASSPKPQPERSPSVRSLSREGSLRSPAQPAVQRSSSMRSEGGLSRQGSVNDSPSRISSFKGRHAADSEHTERKSRLPPLLSSSSGRTASSSHQSSPLLPRVSLSSPNVLQPLRAPVSATVETSRSHGVPGENRAAHDRPGGTGLSPRTHFVRSDSEPLGLAVASAAPETGPQALHQVEQRPPETRALPDIMITIESSVQGLLQGASDPTGQTPIALHAVYLVSHAPGVPVELVREGLVKPLLDLVETVPSRQKLEALTILRDMAEQSLSHARFNECNAARRLTHLLNDQRSWAAEKQLLEDLTIEILHKLCGGDNQRLSDVLLSSGASHLMRAVENNSGSHDIAFELLCQMSDCSPLAKLLFYRANGIQFFLNQLQRCVPVSAASLDILSRWLERDRAKIEPILSKPESARHIVNAYRVMDLHSHSLMHDSLARAVASSPAVAAALSMEGLPLCLLTRMMDARGDLQMRKQAASNLEGVMKTIPSGAIKDREVLVEQLQALAGDPELKDITSNILKCL